MRYKIFEGNMERLEKKLGRIANKCRKYGNNFHYEVTGEEFEEQQDENGNKYIVRYVIVDVEGTAIINNWKFIGTVDHTSQGNIIKCCCDVEVPERYYNSTPYCEHCGRKMARRNTYIIQNVESGEFKQVGKSCLADFTNGMSAEHVAHYISLHDELIQGEAIEPGCHSFRYIRTKEALQYAAEVIRCFGYVKADGENPTKYKVLEYYKAENGMLSPREILQEVRLEMDSVSFNKDSEEIIKLAENVMEWIKQHEEINNYFHNLKVTCSLDYVAFDKIGILASVFPAYNREMERRKEIERQRKAEKGSEYVGNVKDRITIDIAQYEIATSWETSFGTTRIYKIMDANGNVFTWKTGNVIEEGTKTIIGTVKAHSEYNGTKQTELTRCRVA